MVSKTMELVIYGAQLHALNGELFQARLKTAGVGSLIVAKSIELKTSTMLFDIECC